jgi:hypothetical protein
MRTLSRRQFLGKAAGAAALAGVPQVWSPPAWAQAKEVRVLAWSHLPRTTSGSTASPSSGAPRAGSR